MHKKRIRDSFYYYTTIRKGEKTDSVYLGRNFSEAKKKEISLKNLKLSLIILLFLVSAGIVFADTIPINVRPLSGGSIQANTAFDYRFDFTSDQACATVLHSVTKTVTTDKYGIGFVEIDVSPLNDTPSYLCEYRAATGGALALRKVHNISTGLFNRSLGKNVKYDYVNITGNLTLGQKTTFALGSYLQEIANWFVSSTSLAVQGDLNVTGNVNVTGYVNASTVYSGGTNLSTLATYAYNQTEYALTIISTNVSALNASLLSYINANITNLNASINYNYNESNYVLTITNTNFTALNESVTKWLYNMSDGAGNLSWNESYANTKYSNFTPDNFNVTNLLNATNITSEIYKTNSDVAIEQETGKSFWVFRYGYILFLSNYNTGLLFNTTTFQYEFKVLGKDIFTINAVSHTASVDVINATNITAQLINSTGDLYTKGALVNSSLLYNMSDGSYNATYEGLNISYGQFWYNHTSAVGTAYSTGDTNLQSNISAVNTSLMIYVNTNITNLNVSIVANYVDNFIAYWYNHTLAVLTYLTASSNNLQSNISAVNTSLMTYINANITNLNASLIYNYNQSHINMTTNLTIGIEQAPGTGMWFGDDYNASIFWNGSNLIIKG